MTRLLIPTILLASATLVAQQPAAPQPHDHAQMNARGQKGMGFDQAATTHHFYLLEEGGAIQVTVKNASDKSNLTAIQAHLPHIAKLFAAGDFSTPHYVHGKDVPGSQALKRLRDRITYSYEDIPGGGRVRLTTRHASALSAVHEFLRYQITEHKTGDPMQVTRLP